MDAVAFDDMRPEARDIFVVKCQHCGKMTEPWVDIYTIDGKHMRDAFCVRCGRIIRRVEVH